jgi:outer membrane protein TolC
MKVGSVPGARRGAIQVARVAALMLCAASVSYAQSADVPLRLGADDAVSLALRNNLGLESARRGPEIADLDIEASGHVWNPEVSAAIGRSRADSPPIGAFDSVLGVLTDRELTSRVSVDQQLPWGTSYQADWYGLRRSNNSVLNRFAPELNAGLSASVTQPLLRGFTFDAARADRARSLRAGERAQLQLDAAVASLKREVLYAYWQWVHARDLRAVALDALALARALLDGNRQRVAAGAMAPTDVIEAEAEVARRDEAVIVADKDVANAEDRLRVLVLRPGAPEYRRPLEPAAPTPVELPAHDADDVTSALAARADVQILKSAIATDAINVRQFRNDARPDLDVSAGFSASGVGGSELLREGGLGTPIVGSFDRGFGLVLQDLARFKYPAWSMQLSVRYPLGATVAKTNAARAQVERRQTELELDALQQRVEVDMRTAQREVDANEKRMRSTETAVALAERRLDGEERKFLVGLSTSFFVFQAQRDLASARVARLGAILDRRLSIADLEAIRVTPLMPIR